MRTEPSKCSPPESSEPARPKVIIATDGACKGNPGIGGWGAIMRAANGSEKTLSGAELHTTNNRMELTGAIFALNALTRPADVILSTDSVYVRDGITKWIHGWKRNGWRTADKKPVKNADLWEALLAATSRHKVEWRWVKGHSGDPDNECADALANAAIAALRAG